MTRDALLAALADPARAAVVEVAADDVELLLGEAGRHLFATFQVDLSGRSDAAAVHAKLQESLGFPEWYGLNWDALSDCLRDFEWYPAPGYVLALQGVDELRRADPTAHGLFLEVLADACASWSVEGVPFWVLLVSNR